MVLAKHQHYIFVTSSKRTLRCGRHGVPLSYEKFNCSGFTLVYSREQVLKMQAQSILYTDAIYVLQLVLVLPTVTKHCILTHRSIIILVTQIPFVL